MAPATGGVPSRQPAVSAAEAAAQAARRTAAAPVYIPVRSATQRPLPQHKATILPLPRTIALARQGFNPDTFNGGSEAAQLQAQGKILGADTATIRWKWADDSKSAKVTNTKFIKWSDGSTTLHVGEDVFHVSASQLLADCELLFAGTQAAAVEGQGTEETVLEAIAPVSRRLQIRPLHGNTATKAVLLARQGTLREGMQLISTAKDAEAIMAKRIKVTDDALVAQSRAAAREAALAARATRGGRVGDMEASFLESEEGLDFDDAAGGMGLKELKKSMRSGTQEADLFAAESDSDSAASEAAAGDEESDDASDEEEGAVAVAPAAEGAAATMATARLSDSESEDEDFDPSKPAAAGSGDSGGSGDSDDDEEEDDLFDDDDEEGDAGTAGAAVAAGSDSDGAAPTGPVGGTKRVGRGAAVVESSDEEEEEEGTPAVRPASKKARAGGTVLDGGDSDSE